MRKELIVQIYYSAVLLVFIVFLQGCESSTNTEISITGYFSVTFKSPAITPKVEIDGLQISEVKILVRDLKLISAIDEDSMNIEIGSFVINVSPSGLLNTYNFDNAYNGSFESIKWEIHKPEDNEIPPDPDFNTGESGKDRFSVIVQGMYNDVPFTYKSSKSTQQVIHFDDPILLEAGDKINVTLLVDPNSWFISNGLLLDPNDSHNESEIDNQISSSFKDAFRDDNFDGNPD